MLILKHLKSLLYLNQTQPIEASLNYPEKIRLKKSVTQNLTRKAATKTWVLLYKIAIAVHRQPCRTAGRPVSFRT